MLPGMERNTCLIEATKRVVSVLNSVRSEAVVPMVVELITSIWKDDTNFGEEISLENFILRAARDWRIHCDRV
jgi:hypothetical protein